MPSPDNLCATCGTQYPADFTGDLCVICQDDRQYIPFSGQEWTSSDALLQNHSVKIEKLRDQLYELVIHPKFAIGQRALLVLSEQGNVLWDCIPLFDEATEVFIKQKGGLKAIVISHPHYYSTMAAWAERFDCPVYVHQEDKIWVMDPSPRLHFWKGNSLELWDGMSLLKIGGHFPGSSILKVPGLSEKAALLCGDTFFLSPSREHISVMYSYPNNIPVPLAEIARIKALVTPLEFDDFYGHFPNLNLNGTAKATLLKSLDRYC